MVRPQRASACRRIPHNARRAIRTIPRHGARSDRIPAGYRPAKPTSPSAHRWSRPAARSARRIRCCAAPAPRCAPATRDTSRRCRWRSPPVRRRSAAARSGCRRNRPAPARSARWRRSARRRAATARATMVAAAQVSHGLRRCRGRPLMSRTCTIRRVEDRPPAMMLVSSGRHGKLPANSRYGRWSPTPSARRAKCSSVAVVFEQPARTRVAQLLRAAGDQIEHRLRIARRGRHRLQHVDGGGLMLDPLADTRCCAAPAPRCAPATRDTSRRCRWRSPPVRRRSAAVPSGSRKSRQVPAGRERWRRSAVPARSSGTAMIARNCRTAEPRARRNAPGPPRHPRSAPPRASRIARPNMVAVLTGRGNWAS